MVQHVAVSGRLPAQEVAPKIVSIFLTISLFDWRTGGIVKGQVTGSKFIEEPMIVLHRDQAWLAQVRPEGARTRITPEGERSFYLPTDQISAFAITDHIDDDTLPRYECSLDGLNLSASPATGELLGLSASKIEGMGWLKAIKPSERERVYFEWLSCVERRLLYRGTYNIVNQESGLITHCKTLAAIEHRPGKSPVYRGVVFPFPQK